MFNTNSLAYKLISGKLKENRKHSEQLNKYLAGLIDADGCLSLHFTTDRNPEKTRMKLCLSLGQSASVDPDFTLLRALRNFYNLGSVYYRVVDSEVHKSSIAEWRISTKESLILLNRIGKHLRIKGTHFDNLVWLMEELKAFAIPLQCVEELKEFSKCSRKNSKWVTHPRHLSWAWVAGFLDGDGHYRFRERKDTNHKEIYITFNCGKNDEFIADFFKVCFKGNVYHNAAGLVVWKRALGKANKAFSLPFLRKLKEYICIEYKYTTVLEMIKYLDGKDVAETERQPSES